MFEPSKQGLRSVCIQVVSSVKDVCILGVYILFVVVTFKHLLYQLFMDMSRVRQLNGNKKTVLCCYQLKEKLIEPFNQKVNVEFGRYKRSKVVNALIQDYLNGKYNLQQEPRTNNNDYDMEC